MTEEEIYYTTVGEKVIGVIKSQMFGKPCFKIKKSLEVGL